MLYQSLKEQGIRFYMTEHIASLNEQLRKLGLGYMIEEGSVRRTIHIALKDMGITRPPGSVQITVCRNSYGHLVLNLRNRLRSRLSARSNS